MVITDRRPGDATFWQCFVGAFTLGTLLAAVQWGMEKSATGPVDWGRAVAVAATTWYTCALVCVPLVWLTRHHPADARRLYLWAIIYVPAAALSSLIWLAIFVPMHNAFFASRYTFLSEARSEFLPDFVGILGIVGIFAGVRFFIDGREREVRSAQLEGEVAKARLEALQSQLHPHFLFNTLHCVSTLMRRDVEKADEMLERLCDLLRIGLDDRPQIPLVDELSVLEQYVDIMEMRFPNLHVRIAVPADLHELRVPTLILQPLVENAVLHGLDESAGQVSVVISAEREDGALLLRVADNGRGLPADDEVRLGLGLENTRRRLDVLYGSRSALRITRSEPGTLVELKIPVQ
jgi:signal transduction histidine kinase